MTYSSSLSETLQNLAVKGYRITDLEHLAIPEDAIQSHDWRLDAMHHVKTGSSREPQTLVIAVSSAHKHLKLAFVRELLSKQDFSPLTLLRRLFPTHKRSGIQPV
ncbi:MAG TPA: hypothetical protein PLO67_03925 [Saprospiraceae bacterium]|nr:hypothetical protein [Saprospiraceae bacterium]HPI05102.1 hypothetical protein [Saprospiraceae bacterium]